MQNCRNILQQIVCAKIWNFFSTGNYRGLCGYCSPLLDVMHPAALELVCIFFEFVLVQNFSFVQPPYYYGHICNMAIHTCSCHQPTRQPPQRLNAKGLQTRVTHDRVTRTPHTQIHQYTTCLPTAVLFSLLGLTRVQVWVQSNRTWQNRHHFPPNSNCNTAAVVIPATAKGKQNKQ